MILIKTEILTSPKVLYKKYCTRKQFLFCKKMLSGFFSLKMSASAKRNWHSLFVKIFQVSADEGMGK